MKFLTSSLYLGKIAGTKIYVHWTFFLLLFWMFYSRWTVAGNWKAALIGVAFILLLFACVTLHEFGHILVARLYKYPTKKITLLPIGGIAQMEKMPEKPGQELLVALAGPAVNMVIAGILGIYLYITKAFHETFAPDYWYSGNIIFNLFVANIILAIFNLVPAFPMDGGRVLRALLSLRIERTKATKIAARVGQGFAIVFILLSFLGNLGLFFIGVLILISAGGEAALEMTKAELSKYKVADVMMSKYSVLEASDTLDKAAQLLLAGQEKGFLVKEGEQVKGTITRKDIIEGLERYGNNGRVEVIMHKEATQLQQNINLQDVYFVMLQDGNSLSAVYDKDKVVGMIDTENISEALLLKEALEKFTRTNTG